MTTDPEPVLTECSLQQAIEITGMSKQELAGWGISRSSSVLLCEGDLRSPADGVVPECDLLMVTGNIAVAGTLWQQEAALFVRGGVTARNFVTGGWSSITGPIVLEGVLYGDSTCDRAMDFSTVTARAIIDHGHSFRGARTGLEILAQAHGGGLAEPDCGPDELRRVLVDEVLDEDDQLDATELLQRLSRGEEVLRPGAETARQEQARSASKTTWGAEVDLRGTALDTLPAELFHQPQVRRLDLTHGAVEALPAAIVQLQALETLVLDDSRITALPEALWRLPRLAELSLAGLGLTELPPEIGACRSLSRLVLDRTRITTLPRELGQLPLTALSLSGTRLTALPAWLRELPALRTLNLGFGQQMARDVARQALQLAQLTSLSLDRHKIAELWDDIGRLSGLRSLDLAYNELTGLPDALFMLRELEALELSGNSALVVPRQLTRLTKLRTLRLSSTRREDDLPWLAELPALRELALGSLRLPAVPPSVLALRELEALDLGSNYQLRLGAEIASWPHLRRLDLRGTAPSARALHQLAELRELRELNLSSCNLDYFPEALCELPHLERLDLIGNAELRVPGALARLTSLKHLAISGCKGAKAARRGLVKALARCEIWA